MGSRRVGGWRTRAAPTRPVDEQPHRTELGYVPASAGWLGPGASSDGTRQVASPGTASGSRLVVSTETDELVATTALTGAAQSPTRCSQLSRISREASLKARATGGAESTPGTRPTPTMARMAAATECPSAIPASSTHRTSWGPPCSAATAWASRVLPTPAPVNVTSRSASSNASTSQISRSRDHHPSHGPTDRTRTPATPRRTRQGPSRGDRTGKPRRPSGSTSPQAPPHTELGDRLRR
jgi:hypothetical protein